MCAPGTIDFTEYWSAYQLFKQGLNGYDPTLLLVHERLTGFNDSIPKMYWSPPWALTIMAPVLELPFELAARVWLAVNAALWLMAAAICSLAAPKNRLFAFTACLLCYPAMDVLRLGQTGLLLTLASACLWYALKKKNYWLAGCTIPILLIKPHLFYLTLVWLLFRIRDRRFWYGALGAFTLLLTVTELVIPNAIGYWVPTLLFGESSASATPRITYFTSTLGGLVRTLLPFNGDYLLIALIPIVTLLIFLRALKNQKEPHDLSLFLSSISLSLFTAPYGWFHDASVLLPLHAEIGAGKSRLVSSGFLLLLICQIVAYYQPFISPSYALTAWYPIGIWMAWRASKADI